MSLEALLLSTNDRKSYFCLILTLMFLPVPIILMFAILLKIFNMEGYDLLSIELIGPKLDWLQSLTICMLGI